MNAMSRRPNGFATKTARTSATILNRAEAPGPESTGLHLQMTRELVSRIFLRRRSNMALTRRDFLCRTAGAAALMVPGAGFSESAFHISEEVEAFYRKSISGDSLVYTEDYSSNLDSLTLNAIRDSGMTYAFYDVSITPNGRSFDDCIRSVALWNESVVRSKNFLIRADCAGDIVTAKKTGKHALIYLFQDAYPLERNLDLLRLFYDQGVRVLQLTHNGRNFVGDGYVDRANGGLTAFGFEVVAGMNELRMLVDLSHCGEQTTFEAIRHSN